MQNTNAILIFMLLTDSSIPASAYNSGWGQALEFQRSLNLESEGTLAINSFRRKEIFFSSFSGKCFSQTISKEKFLVRNYRTLCAMLALDIQIQICCQVITSMFCRRRLLPGEMPLLNPPWFFCLFGVFFCCCYCSFQRFQILQQFWVLITFPP